MIFVEFINRLQQQYGISNLDTSSLGNSVESLPGPTQGLDQLAVRGRPAESIRNTQRFRWLPNAGSKAESSMHAQALDPQSSFSYTESNKLDPSAVC